MIVLDKLIFVASVLQLINEASANSLYSNDIDEELSQEPPEYLPSHHDITQCTYVRHFGPYSGNISCPNTAAALITIQTKLVRQPPGVSPSNQHLPNTNWSMQCHCPPWSYQDTSSLETRSTWKQFTTSSYPNTSFSCNNNEFVSGLAYQYSQQNQNVTWWGRCTRFHGYFIRDESCRDSERLMPDGADNLLSVTLPLITALHRVDDYPIQHMSSGGDSNRREKKFKECNVFPIPRCDNPSITHGSTALLPSMSLTVPTSGQLDLENGLDQTKHGDSLQVSCNTGYYVNGPSVITCQMNGTWTQLPTCKTCRPIRNCISVECRYGNESFCLECKAHTDKIYYHKPLKFVLNKNRKRCRIVPNIDSRWIPSEITFEHMSTVRLTCPSVGRPAPTITWTLNNMPLTSLTTNEEMFDFYRGNLYSDGSLVLKYLTDRDEGVYMCTATNDVGSDSMSINLTSNEAQLKRELEGNSSLSAPIIHNKGPFMLFSIIDTVASVHCNATGNPPPTIKWYKLEVAEDEVRSFRLLKYGNPQLKQHGNGTLEFANIHAWDMGMYSCLATNKYGSDVMHKYIRIGNHYGDYIHYLLQMW